MCPGKSKEYSKRRQPPQRRSPEKATGCGSTTNGRLRVVALVELRVLTELRQGEMRRIVATPTGTMPFDVRKCGVASSRTDC